MMQSDFDRYKQDAAAAAKRREADLEPTISRIDAFLIEKQISLGLIVGPVVALLVVAAIVLLIVL